MLAFVVARGEFVQRGFAGGVVGAFAQLQHEEVEGVFAGEVGGHFFDIGAGVAGVMSQFAVCIVPACDIGFFGSDNCLFWL